MSEVDQKPWQISLQPSFGGTGDNIALYGPGGIPINNLGTPEVETSQLLAGIGVSLARDLVDTNLVLSPRFDLSYYTSWASRTRHHVDEVERTTHRVVPLFGLELGIDMDDGPYTSSHSVLGGANAFFLVGPEFFPGQDVGGDIEDKIGMKGGVAINFLGAFFCSDEEDSQCQHLGLTTEFGGRSMYNPISRDAQGGFYFSAGLAHRF